jgi:hypothetical protein
MSLTNCSLANALRAMMRFCGVCSTKKDESGRRFSGRGRQIVIGRGGKRAEPNVMMLFCFELHFSSLILLF